jgi:hypothetical protein
MGTRKHGSGNWGFPPETDGEPNYLTRLLTFFEKMLYLI